MSLLGQMIRATSFRQFLDFASPSFFEVMPTRALWSEGRALMAAYRDAQGFEQALAHRRPRVEGFGVELSQRPERAATPLRSLDEEARRKAGQRILEIYFHQLLDPEGPTLLDLSLVRWTFSEDRLVWHPGRGHKSWPEDFRSALAEVYVSFYTAQGELEDALERLGLAVATDLFVKHFGEGDQRAVQFRVDHFTASFHQVFLRCRQHKVKLQPSFLPLGIYLATLYETLSAIDLPLDVRSAFEVALESRSGPA
jgi:hypothetical protein